MRGFVGGRPGGRRIYADEEQQGCDLPDLRAPQGRGVLVRWMLWTHL